MLQSILPFLQTHGLVILAIIPLVVTVACWVVGSRRDKTAADRLLMESGFKEDDSFAGQIDDLLKRELRQQRKKAAT